MRKGFTKNTIASPLAGSLSMSSPSGNVDNRAVFSFVGEAISSADVVSVPFDSTDSIGYRQSTAAQYSSSLAAGSWTINQLTIIFHTDEDGQTVVFQAQGGGYLGIMPVITTKKQCFLSTPEPPLRGKEFFIYYYSIDDEIATCPVPLSREGSCYLGALADVRTARILSGRRS